MQVQNVIIWGNHSSTQFPDASHATVEMNGSKIPVSEAINNNDYLLEEFVTVNILYFKISVGCIEYLKEKK